MMRTLVLLKTLRRLRWIGLGGVLIYTLFVAPAFLAAQTTGKIFGAVFDAASGQPLVGVNLLLQESRLGAVSALDGSFLILNVPPGAWRMAAKMIGYESVLLQNLQVSVNRTTTVRIPLRATVIEGEEVVVQADKIATRKDQTSTIRNVSSGQIALLPVEDVAGVVGLQAGVVAGHFRGGRSSEVAYLIDGIQVSEPFRGEAKNVEIEPEAIQDLEVITGTFNAEYGRAMSGIVNAVTKEGGDQWHGAASAAAAHYSTTHDDIFPGLSNGAPAHNQDYKLSLSGPLFRNRLHLFTNLRYQDQKSYLNGVRRFRPGDYSDFSSPDPAAWLSQHSGDSAWVPLNDVQEFSLFGKVSTPLTAHLKAALIYTRNQEEGQSYSHYYKYNPDGQPTRHNITNMLSLQVNHMLSPRAFYEAKVSQLAHDYGYYLFENPLDGRYVNDIYGENDGSVGFSTGGQDKGHTRRTLTDWNAKWDLTWQLHAHHSLKGGVLYTRHDIDNRASTIRNLWYGTNQERLLYEPVVYPDTSIFSDIYRVKPREFSAYLQDKIEYDEIVINFGLRYDWFDPNTTYPSQRRNPANQLSFPGHPEKMSVMRDAPPQMQLSPRLGLSYKLGTAALMHFSYGHFFQMPPLYALYENHSLQVSPNDYETMMGDPTLGAQKTVQYEVGLWQQLNDRMGLELALFYRDIYSLLSSRVVTTFNQIEYGLYCNKDYGNAKGLELKYNFQQRPVQIDVNYTLQYTRGNADDPTFTFTRAGEAKDPVPALIPMSWDQRHTFNVTANYLGQNYGWTATGYYDSGTPYTWAPLAENPLARINLYPNNAVMPGRMSLDLSGFWSMHLYAGVDLRMTLAVYNLFDRLNESSVNSRTGRAYSSIITSAERAGHRSDFNRYEDRVRNPAMYAAPRLVKLGMGVTF